MNKSFRRIIWALFLSLSVWGGTHYFSLKYKSSRASVKDQKPVATAKQIFDEVERRPVTSLVWSVVETGEFLYPGEAIKTSENGEVRIQFNNSSRYIDLEPDSLIVIGQADGNEISLDLQGGSLFVSQGESNAQGGSQPALLLNSANGKVDLSNATAQLSKSNGKEIDVQVLKGKAKIESNGQSKELDADKKTSQLEILAPAVDKVVYVNPENPLPVTFKWKGLPENSQVSLFVGKKRNSLKEFPTTDKTSQSFLAKIPLGKSLWRLSAFDPVTQKSIESAIYRIELASRYAPTPLSPAADGQFSRSLKEHLTQFKWTRPDEMKSVYLEVAKDPQLKEKVFSQNILDKDSLEKSLPDGVYYWRLSGTYEGLNSVLTSKTLKFEIAKDFKKPEELKPVVLQWSTPSETQPQYFIDEPLAQLGWTVDQKERVKQYRIKLAPSEEILSQPEHPELLSKETPQESIKTLVKKPGRYIAMVEALDNQNQVLAKTNLRTVEIQPLPLLKSPRLLPETGELSSTKLGRLDLTWSQVEGAREYWITLFDSTGKELRKAKFEKLTTTLVNLLPGRYQVQVHAVDQHGRESDKSDLRWVSVPDSSDINAPRLKKIKVN